MNYRLCLKRLTKWPTELVPCDLPCWLAPPSTTTLVCSWTCWRHWSPSLGALRSHLHQRHMFRLNDDDTKEQPELSTGPFQPCQCNTTKRKTIMGIHFPLWASGYHSDRTVTNIWKLTNFFGIFQSTQLESGCIEKVFHLFLVKLANVFSINL